MKAIAIVPFDDLQERVPREPGDEFECTEERFEQINSTEFGELAKAAEPEQAQEPENAPVPEPEAAELEPEPETKPKAAKTRTRKPAAKKGQ